MIDYRDLFHSDDQMAAATIAWLEKHSYPMAWHRSAYSTNWDCGYRVLGWIVSQPSCDRATAVHVFWAALPYEVIDPAGEWHVDHVRNSSSVYHLLELIIDLLGKGRYAEEDFETQWSEEWQEGTRQFASMIGSSPTLHPKWRHALALQPKRPIFEWNPHPAFPDGIPSEIYYANNEFGSAPNQAH